MNIQSTKKPTIRRASYRPHLAAKSSEKPPEKDTGPSEQALRISNFVQEKKLEGLQALKQVSGLVAGQLTGMTIGSLIFAPLALKMGNLYIATGGAAITGGLMALGASKLAEKDFSKFTNNKVGDAYAGIGAIAKSLPKIAYPTLVGVPAAEKAIYYGALDGLPLSGVTSAPTIDLVKGLEDVGASGLATPLFSHNRIFLDVDQMALGKSWAQEVTIHEIGHTYDFSKGVGPIGSRNFRGGGFGKEPFISNYAHTNRMEDYAESYAHYHLEPERLQSVAPDKFAALEESQAPGIVDKALDREEVRDLGKKIGSAFEPIPRARNLLALGSSLVGPFQLYRGATSLEKGIETGDAMQRVQGKMSMASGAALMGPGTAPMSLLFTAGQMLTNSQLAKGTITPETAEKRADLALTTAAGPFGMIANSVQGQLSDAGLLVDLPNSKLFTPGLEKKSYLKIGAGFGLGAAAGGVLAPFLHGSLLHTGSIHAQVAASANGAWIGGLAGAALGLGIHLLTSRSGKDKLAADPLALTKGDKKLLWKAATPTVAGGVAGAVGGYFGGQAIGQIVGQFLGGPAGAVTGASLGGYIGTLCGSLALAKGGAKLGSKLAGLAKKE